MSSLLAILKQQILKNGPMALEDYMKAALLHPEFGYYQRGETFGAKGDFVTAPEISQMFGELIGLWSIDCWVKLGSPEKFHLVELGPGNGTLMSDALRSAALVPEFLSAAEITLVEASEQLTLRQQQTLSSYSITWCDVWPTFRDTLPIIVIGNEFLDALPVRQYEQVDGHWAERKIALAKDKLIFKCEDIAASALPENLPSVSECDEGSIFETNPSAEKICSNIAANIAKNGGSALFIDYGPSESGLGDSFQSVQHHKYTDPLDNPGTSDLTAHVDFARLGHLATVQNCETYPISSQGRFLERLGIEARALVLSRNAADNQKAKIAGDLQRLISSKEMGTLFKAMTFYANMTEGPAGFGE